ncbi:secreted protein [Rhodopirellula maiorica SM1]|uniref:Secreted protein n=1 Tax=Rhodopirellula maiorica SM1 TaxID=1265738 RepID=M5RA03_9BACT|nr:hypothetical protein [Rhodopirellula maiorica]EMI16313.1 secreted protein [Rhodopirellula maiorica SM1]
MSGNRKPKLRHRRGAAFLLLVVVVLMVVVEATRTMVVGEFSLRKTEMERARVRTMIAAIDAVATLNEETIELPIDSANQERIVVTMGEDQRVLARWMRGESVVDQITRQQPVSESEE